MEKMKKVLKGNKAAAIISLVCIIALAVSVPKTISYLSASSEKVVNTFAAGAISLTLDEAKVDGNGQETDDSRVTENTYKIVPGRTLDKDPTVTVLEGSEVCYVFLYVDDPLSLGTYADYFTVDYSSDWIKAAESGTASIYVYKTTVDASEDDVELPAIFTQIKISIDLTSEQAAALEGTEITVKAYAVQTENITLEDALAFAEEYFADEFAEDGSTITWTSSGNTVSVAGAWTESADDESTEESETKETSTEETTRPEEETTTQGSSTEETTTAAQEETTTQGSSTEETTTAAQEETTTQGSSTEEETTAPEETSAGEETTSQEESAPEDKETSQEETGTEESTSQEEQLTEEETSEGEASAEETSSDETGTESTSTKTGDENALTLWMLVMCIALLGLACTAVWQLLSGRSRK